jgi:hypothetical protein
VHTVYLLARTLGTYLDSALCFGGLKLPRIFLFLFFVVPELPAWKAFQLFTLFCLDSWNKQLTHTFKFTQIITIKAQLGLKLNSCQVTLHTINITILMWCVLFSTDWTMLCDLFSIDWTELYSVSVISQTNKCQSKL